LKAERKLEALEGCGVDNWEGYDDAMKIFWDEEVDEEGEEGEDEEEEIYSQGPPHIAFVEVKTISSIPKGWPMKIFGEENFLK